VGLDIGLLSVGNLGIPYGLNPAERAVIATIISDGRTSKLDCQLAGSENGEVKDSSTDWQKGSGQSAIFVAGNRFAVLNQWTGAPSPFYQPLLIS
jgi:coatomer subunit alpha